MIRRVRRSPFVALDGRPFIIDVTRTSVPLSP
jgi:hypothetical protein